MKNMLIAIVMFAVASCASYKPPKQKKNVVTEITVTQPVEATFSKCNRWLLENDFTVSFKDKKPYQLIADGDISKLSGLNYSAWDGIGVTNAVADCGEAGIITFYPTQAKIIIMLDSLGGETTKVKVSASFHKFNPEPNPSVSGILRCVTTGVIESGLFTYLKTP